MRCPPADFALEAGVRAAFGDDAWALPEDMGVDDAEITTVRDVTPFWDAKLRAIAAHASQADAAMLLQIFSAAVDPAATAAQVEEYVRAYPPPTATDVVEADFFSDWERDVPPQRR